MTRNKKITARLALTAAVVFLILWGLLGTGTSLAWFYDEDEAVRNVFNFPEFQVQVEYKNEDMTDYDELAIDSAVLGEGDLFEPGFTKLAFLKVENLGQIEVNYKLSVDIRDYTIGKSVLGNDIYLPDYLRYGVSFSSSEEALTRDTARLLADMEMNSLSMNSFSEWDSVSLLPGETRYVALAVWMPEEVGNQANFRDLQPKVELGITVFAEQSVKS